MESDPTDDMVVLATLLCGPGEHYAEEIASVLRRLGFPISSQKMVGMLRRLCAEDMPMIAARRKMYAVTLFGHNQLGSRFPPTWALRERWNWPIALNYWRSRYSRYV